MKNQVDELTLLLLYLTSFKEELAGEEALRSWKGYPFSSLDELMEDNYIYGSRRAKSVMLSEEGEKVAKELMKKYQIKEEQ
ncbi:DUF6429 family protein [Halobacillus sp. A1]|uniref:DUF6429 family protein n=1 Tax=Halobacillus sp. A1 TaxID=2880262 RepID=UPI0020A68A7D|nr:DUF6429 family protein [Halobacillus sp. A1]MCP3032342.1 DUF6429 family protein [Halobacillus sp. A1]